MNEENKNIAQAGANHSEYNDSEAMRTIDRMADEENDDKSGEISWRSLLGGDLLKSKFLMKQVVFLLYLTVLMLLYTGNRYASQQDAILTDSLQNTLKSERYNVMTVSSELSKLSRQSEIIHKLRELNDTSLLNNSTPPFTIDLKNSEK